MVFKMKKIFIFGTKQNMKEKILNQTNNYTNIIRIMIKSYNKTL